MNLIDLIEQDYEVIGNGRWLRTEEHNSLVIDSERDLFFWNSKGVFGNVYDWLIRIKNLTPIEASEVLKGEQIPTTTRSADKIFLRQEEEQFVPYPELVKVFWENGKEERDYWYKRGLTDQTIDRFLLGYFDGFNTIPIFINGVFLNFQMRRDDPKTIRPWYRGIGGLPFNADLLKVVNSVVITEGPVDAILLNQKGIPAVSHTGGNQGFKPEWIKYFIYQEEIFYVEDNDEAGRQAAKKIESILGIFRFRKVRFIGFPEHYDTVDFFRDGHTVDEFKRLMYDSDDLDDFEYKDWNEG